MTRPNVENIDELINDTAEEVVEETKEENVVDYGTLTVSELREEVKQRGVTGYSKLKKDELIAILTDATQEEVEEKPEVPEVVESTEEVKGSVVAQPYQPLPYKNEKTWLDVYLANYNGTSDIAKEIESYIKDNYQGVKYIPWATMERLTYMCDPNARFIPIQNANGGLVHTDSIEVYQQNIQKGETVSETKSYMFSHTVKILLQFMGKEFVEDYPIQDMDYSAARVFNQNLVNRAIQRAKAKVASRGTGLGLKLYEGHDLQFEEKETTLKKPVVKEPAKPKVVKKEVAPVVKDDKPVVTPKPEVKEEVKPEVKEDVATTVNAGEDVHAVEIVQMLRNSDANKVNTVLQRVNVAVMSNYKFALTLTDTDEELLEKIGQFRDAGKFKKSIQNMLESV